MMSQDPSGETRLQVDLQPRVEHGAALVSVTLGLLLPGGYPTADIPQVTVERSRGLGDAAIGSLLSAAKRACEEHGQQEVGCMSQLLDEVSEALDVANDTSECNICLLPCNPGDKVVRADCDHIFHAECIGHWDFLKSKEAAAAANDAQQSIVATRDAVQREVEEFVNKGPVITVQLADCRERVSKSTKLVEVARIKQAGGERADDLDIDAETA